MLGGMLAPTTGRVILDGQSLYDIAVTERARIRNQSIGFVFQNFSLVPWLTALENVQLPLCLSGADSQIQQSRARELLTQFGLEGRLDHKPTELSAGQQQRAALARTLVQNPALILADEPTGNLDPQLRDAVLGTLAECHAEGRTIVMVTHDPAAAESADRILRIVDGVVHDEGSPGIAGAA
jgi:putative ABC transport system ATP-binding protein